MLKVDFKQFIRDRMWFGWRYNSNAITVYWPGYTSKWTWNSHYKWVPVRVPKGGQLVEEDGIYVWYE